MKRGTDEMSPSFQSKECTFKGGRASAASAKYFVPFVLAGKRPFQGLFKPGAGGFDFDRMGSLYAGFVVDRVP